MFTNKKREGIDTLAYAVSLASETPKVSIKDQDIPITHNTF